MEAIEKGDFFNINPWTPATPQSVAKFSAVAYYFGKKLSDSLQIPIGLIHNAIGGSTIESWINRDNMLAHPQLSQLATKEWYTAPLGLKCQLSSVTKINIQFLMAEIV